MSAVFLLIRHATNDFVGKALAGRAPGVRLNDEGKRQAEHLADRLGTLSIAAIYVSPLERAHETAAPLAARLDIRPRERSELHEIDCGDWTGKTFRELDADPEWRVWVTRRSEARPPRGESIAEAQRRAVDLIMRLRAEHDAATIALVSHGDVIKATLAHFLRMSLDALETFDIAPASVSAIQVGADWAQVKLVNETGSLPLA
jgi:probable phosphomutase (TIGR03848 family)